MLIKPRLLPHFSHAALSRPFITHLPFTLRSKMSTQVPKKHEWFCIMPDQENAIERRLKARPIHFEGLQALIDSGFLTFGGAYLDEPYEEGKPMAFHGSILTCIAESKEAVIETLKKDPYTVGEVWDWNKVEIYSFKCAIREPLQK